jgi:hypothetical protein
VTDACQDKIQEQFVVEVRHNFDLGHTDRAIWRTVPGRSYLMALVSLRTTEICPLVTRVVFTAILLQVEPRGGVGVGTQWLANNNRVKECRGRSGPALEQNDRRSGRDYY